MSTQTFRLIAFDEDGVKGPPTNRRLVCLIQSGGKLAIWGSEGAPSSMLLSEG